jgi:hypothetical protein
LCQSGLLSPISGDEGTERSTLNTSAAAIPAVRRSRS